ncbi:MAG: T9SS type A sorting domain-containing protein [Ignavibacteriaceae bacterium]|nr:T9SS type A sorting domain-containing protein [Ignavibacteriaceae bacterium]
MKQLFSIFLAFLLSTFLLAQDQSPAVELFFITEGVPDSLPVITCTLTAQSQCWGIPNPPPPNPGQYFLTDDYDNPVYVPTGNNLGQWSAGFDFVTSQNGYSVFAYGLYKLTISGSNKYFYLDYRDYRVGYYSPPINGHVIDLWIKYVYSEDKFQFSSHDGWIDYADIINGKLLNIWDIKQKGTQQTSLFPDYWENALVVIEGPDEHPRFAWGKYPGNIQGTIIGYRIYRCANHIPGQPGTFSLFASVDEDVFEYTDETSTVGIDYKANSYYIKCIYTDDEESIFETSATNTIEIQLEIPQKRYLLNNRQLVQNEFNLSQNFPNPFNPSTTIIYTLQENSFVTLKVFDILGNEITTLVDEHTVAGNHSVIFNASELPSGIYFYSLTAGNLTSSKKLILLK